MVSVVVNSFNEGEDLDKCLHSIKDFADDIVVVDMDSSDNTVEVAKKYGSRVFNHKQVDYIEPVREFEVEKAKYDWVLILDPDERLTSQLKSKLKEIATQNEYVAVNIPRLNIFFGKKIKHTNFWPDRQIRFIKKGSVKFSNRIHSYPKVSGEILDLPADENLAIHHYSYRKLSDYVKRIGRYSTIEAKNRFDKGERFSIVNLFFMPSYDFLRRYIRHLGILDGIVGLELSLLQFYYYILVEFKLLKLQK